MSEKDQEVAKKLAAAGCGTFGLGCLILMLIPVVFIILAVIHHFTGF
ncbi:MAG: hypothetical protein ACYSTL_03990 [Planctomycetota bacterium]